MKMRIKTYEIKILVVSRLQLEMFNRKLVTNNFTPYVLAFTLTLKSR
jgi:hypothetical protein